MRLKFTPFDGRGAVLGADVTRDEQPALRAFGNWCATSMPPPGDTWSWMDLPAEREGLDTAADADARRVLVVFGDPALARRFREAWC